MGKQLKEYQLGEVLSFGKYAGRTIEMVIITDPKYIQWCIDKIPEFALSTGSKHALNERLREDKSITQTLNADN